MHYKNGREAKVGDQVIFRQYNGVPAAGIVVAQSSTCETCNLNVIPIKDAGVTITAKNALHIDDALPKSAA